MNWNCLYVSLVFVLLLFSCQNEIETRDQDFLGHDYYPIFAGKFVEYQMDSIVYDKLSQRILHSTSFLREEITGSFVNEAGQDIFVLQLYWKSSLSDPWSEERVWWISMDNEKLIRTEENLSFIKLVFPPEVGVTWDGNALINERTIVDVSGESIEFFKNWEYRILDKKESETIGFRILNDVITVQQADDKNAIERRYSIEKYTRNIGLVYREMMILDTQCIELCANLSWPEKAQRGFILTQTMLDYN